MMLLLLLLAMVVVVVVVTLDYGGRLRGGFDVDDGGVGIGVEQQERLVVTLEAFVHNVLLNRIP